MSDAAVIVEKEISIVEIGGEAEVVVERDVVHVVSVGVQGLQGEPGPAGNSMPTIYFAYGDGTPDTIYTPSSDQVITAITLTVLVPFNGVGAKVSIGTNASPQLLVAENETDLSVLGSYEIDPEVVVAAGTPIRKFITPGAGASQGQAMVQIEYATA
jgi:hypothetical protein